MEPSPFDPQPDKDEKNLKNIAIAVALVGGLAAVGAVLLFGMNKLMIATTGAGVFDEMGAFGKVYKYGVELSMVQAVWGIFTLISGIYLRQLVNWARITIQITMGLGFVAIVGGVTWFVTSNDMPMMSDMINTIYAFSGLMYAAPIPFLIYHLNKPHIKALFQ